MSRVVVIEKNKDGKIELTKEELQKMLDDAYNQGYVEGKYPVWCANTTPSITSKDSVTLNGTEVSI